MPKRDIQLFIADMLEAIEKVHRYVSGLDLERFLKDDLVIDAVVRNLEVIGEAAKHLPSNLRERYTGIDWRRVIGFRNIVIHEYFDVDARIVWTIATQQLQALKEVLQAMLRDIKQQD